MNNLILDANNLLYRTFWVNKTRNGDSAEEDMSVVMFLRSLRSYCEKFNATNVYAVWDKKLTHPSVNFRKQQSAGEYKGNRDGEVAKDAHKHDIIIKEMLDHLGIMNIYPNIMEADDVIAYLTYTLQGKNYIISVDKDLYQLITPNTYVFNPIQKITITPDNFSTYTKGVNIESFLNYKALRGDNSDNIKGLARVGHKRSMILIDRFKHEKPENILTSEQFKQFQSNREIMDLSTGYKYYAEEEPIYKSQVDKGFPTKNIKEFFECCNKYDMKSIIKDRHKWIETFKMSNCLQLFVDKLNT